MKVTILPILFLLALISGCSDDVLQKESNTILAHHIYVMPQGASIDSKLFYEIRDTVFLELDHTYRFYVDHSIGGSATSNEEDFYTSILWEIDGKNYNVKSLQQNFSTPGVKQGFFETVDLFGDTLRTPFLILVNTPSDIHLESPANGYNQVERNPKQGIPLKWKVSGVDSWETASCTVYASENQDYLFESSLGTIDCDKSIYLNGINAGDKISSTAYWAVVLQVESASGRLYRDTSEIFNFSTKTDESVGAFVVIPFLYSQLPSNQEVFPIIQIYNSDGSIAQSIEYNNFPSAAAVSVKPQSDMKVCLVEGKLTEYKSKCQIVSVPENTIVSTDTIIFRDNIPPQVFPKMSAYATGNLLEFFVSDEGSGINPFRLHVVVNGDTVEHAFKGSNVSFKSNCKEPCKVQIVGEDNAKNPLPSSYWQISRDADLVIIKGPFAVEDN